MPVKADFVWMNGKMVPFADAKVHVLTHALHYGTGVFEGIRCYETVKGSAVFRLKEHVKRLFNSAKIYSMKVPYSEEEICKAIKETIKANKLNACYIRPIIYYGFSEMGLNPLKNPIDVSIAVWPWGTYLGEEGLKKGVRCKISSWCRIDSRILPPQAKATANYMNSVIAKLEALDCKYDEAIVTNLNGLIAEGPGENIFIVKEGKVITPPAGAGILFGITRDSAISVARDLGFEVIERDIPREELFTADEAFFTGTAAEVTPIREVDGRIIGSGSRGPITEKIQSTFFDLVKGKNKKYEKWLDYVK
ncbi:branched-chain amino acid transaminase [Candidatus Micrarchaeota archaeon]|nr:branched-chain amino acid transaminase [Candidatus Micrarchaeota archaeon]